jgi:hypothetical protein
MEWLIILLGIIAVGILVKQWKPEWIEKAKKLIWKK